MSCPGPLLRKLLHLRSVSADRFEQQVTGHGPAPDARAEAAVR